MYRRRKLIDQHEAATRIVLRAAAENNSAEVFPKVRVADVLDVQGSGLDDSLYRYALMAHFDFVVCDVDHFPLFAVEFDGSSHLAARAAENDRKKNSICDCLRFPLARVSSEHVFKKARGVDYVTWLTEVYFAFQALQSAQERGYIPEDEPLDPTLFVSLPNLPGRFPLWLSADARIRLQKMHQAGQILNPVPLCLTGQDSQGVTKSLAICARADRTLLLGVGSIYLRMFGVAPSHAAEEIAVVNLAWTVAQDRDGASQDEVRAAIIRFLNSHAVTPTTWGGGSPLDFGLTFEQQDGHRLWRVGALGSSPEQTVES